MEASISIFALNKTRLFVYGGYDPIVGILTDLWKINLKNSVGTWVKVHVEKNEEAPKTFRNSSGKIGDKFYIFGGKLNASTSSSSISCLNLVDDDYYWRTIEPKDESDLELTIDSHSCVTNDPYIYLFGGFLAGEMACYSNNTYRFSSTTEELEEISTNGTRPEARSDHSATIIKNRMYIFGGVSGGLQFNDCWYLDLENKQWTFVKTEGESPSKRIGHESVGVDNFLFILGGSEEVSKIRTNLFMLDTRSNKWTKLGNDLCEDTQNVNESTDLQSYLDKRMSMRSKEEETSSKGKTKQVRVPSPTKTGMNSMKTSKLHSPTRSRAAFSPKKGSIKMNHSNYYTPGVTTNNSGLGSRKGIKISQTKQLKRERLKKKKALEKAELLREFKLTKEELNREVEDPQILLLKSTLEALGSGRDYKIPSPRRNIMKPGVARFHEPVKGKLEPCNLPKLDGLTIHVYREKMFIFGGDRSGLCSNDIYVLDLTSLLLTN